MEKGKVIVLCDDLYEEMEMWYPYYRLLEEGCEVILAGKERKEYRGKNGYPAKPQVMISQINPEEVAAVIIPGGYCPDKLRRYPEVLNLVQKTFARGKVVADICHGPWVLISAGIIKGKQATGFFAVRDDMVNAGAEYLDQAVVVDGNLITSRIPDDLPQFLGEIIAALKSPQP